MSMEKICPCCDIIFLTKLSSKKYCSIKCANVYHVRMWRQNNKKLCSKCKLCYILPESSQCKKCVIKSKTILLSTITLGELKKLTYWNERIRSHARSLVQIRYNCLNCNYTKHQEVCHIKSVSSFQNENTLLEINNSNNLTLLCPNCHWEFDNGLILDIKTLASLEGVEPST